MFNPKDWAPYIDKFGLLTQNAATNQDGGDSTHRFAVTYAMLKVLGSPTWVDGSRLDAHYIYAMLKYEVIEPDGVYRRHPDSEKWYSNPNNFSRDQMTMIENAIIMAKDTISAKAIAYQMFKRRGFHQNIMRNYNEPGIKTPDFITPSEVAALIRGSDAKILSPLLLVLDCFYLVDIVFAVYDDYLSKKKGGRTDAYTMLLTNIIVAKQKFWTPMLWVAGKALGLTDYKAAIQWIFRPESNDPPIDTLLLAAAEKEL